MARRLKSEKGVRNLFRCDYEIFRFFDMRNATRTNGQQTSAIGAGPDDLAHEDGRRDRGQAADRQIFARYFTLLAGSL